MKKILLSHISAQANIYIRNEKPSEYVPFKGKFPLLESHRNKEYTEEIESKMYLEECSEWVQDIILKGQQIFLIDTSFKKYLIDNGKYKNFSKLSLSEKSDELIRFMGENSLGLNRLKIN